MPGKPAGTANVVRVQMCDDNATDRLALQRFGERLLPDSPGFFNIDTGVDKCPAVTVLQQPQVDMPERKRQWHTQPYDARRDGHRLAGLGPLGKFVCDLVFGFLRQASKHHPM